MILYVRGLGANPEAGKPDLDLMKKGQVLVGMFEPLSEPDSIKLLAEKGVSAFSMELMPRITRAQSMDTLSSMATIAGYRAVLLAAESLPKMFPMMMTAAGTVAPAHVFVVGAGVAGLQAIASAKRMGGVVQAYDVRPVVKEQVESLGGKFVELDLETGDTETKGGYAKELGEDFLKKQREMMTKVVAENDVVITTAAVPGKKAPVLVTAEMVRGMKPGSVVVDIAAERGGNCELTRAGETVVENDVKILGPVNMPSDVPYHASQMYSKNLTNFISLLVKEGKPQLDSDDEIIQATMITRDGEVVSQENK
jgi:NAD(P) transhydrogenase subunit alpha